MVGSHSNNASGANDWINRHRRVLAHVSSSSAPSTASTSPALSTSRLSPDPSQQPRLYLHALPQTNPHSPKEGSLRLPPMRISPQEYDAQSQRPTKSRRVSPPSFSSSGAGPSSRRRAATANPVPRMNRPAGPSAPTTHSVYYPSSRGNNTQSPDSGRSMALDQDVEARVSSSNSDNNTVRGQAGETSSAGARHSPSSEKDKESSFALRPVSFPSSEPL